MSEQAHTFNHSHGPCDGCAALGREAERAMNGLATTRAALEHAERALASCKAHAMGTIRAVQSQTDKNSSRHRAVDHATDESDDPYLHTTLHGVKVKVLLDGPNPLPALVADYFAKTQAAIKAGQVPRQGPSGGREGA